MPRDEERYRVAGRADFEGEPIWFTTHCVDRFWERAAVGCTSFRSARDRLVVLVETIGLSSRAPEWAGPIDGVWVALGPDVGIVLDKRRAVTCLARGYTGDHVRAKRNKRRSDRATVTARLRKERTKPGRPRQD